MFDVLRALTQENLAKLKANPYPGRGFVIGRDLDGHLIIVYWIMGRNPKSRNRRLVKGTDRQSIYTEIADENMDMGDTSLILYCALATRAHSFVVSNGDQTDTVMGSACCNTLSKLSDRQYEPDMPNYTARITGVVTTNGKVPKIEIVILRKSPFGETCDRALFSYPLTGIPAGFGYCVTTYSGDGNPIPGFEGEPYLLPIGSGLEEIAQDFWGALNEDNRVALVATRLANGEMQFCNSHIINRFEKVEKGMG